MHNNKKFIESLFIFFNFYYNNPINIIYKEKKFMKLNFLHYFIHK